MRTALVCVDRTRARAQLVQALAAVAGVEQVEGVERGSLVARYCRRPVDLVLVGAEGAGGGLEVARRLVAVCPDATILVLGTPGSAACVSAAISAGARGYLRWDAIGTELVAALAHSVTTTAVLPKPGPARRNPATQLTERELQVLLGISDGKSNAEIGRELFLATDTVKTHTQRIFRKLRVTDRAEAVAHGFRRGLLC
jgi:DNA-binding NarL/FixJ family response regulator